MLRLVELALFLAPFAFFIAWRFMGASAGGPSIGLLIGAACVLVVLAGALLWLSQDEALPPGVAYEPAKLQDGRIVAGHAAPND